MNDNVVFIDANVLLETILKNRRYTEKSQQYLSSHNVVISPLTAHLFVYFGKKDGLKLDVLLGLLSNHSITDFGAQEVAWAIKNHQSDDFEDALQVSCAVTSGAQMFATFDKNLANRYQAFITMDVL